MDHHFIGATIIAFGLFAGIHYAILDAPYKAGLAALLVGCGALIWVR